MLKVVQGEGGFDVVNGDTGEILNKQPFASREEAQMFMESQQTAQDLTSVGAKPVPKPEIPGQSGDPAAALAALMGGAPGGGAPPMPPGVVPKKKLPVPGMGM